MAKYLEVKPTQDGRWAVCSIGNGSVLETHQSEVSARRAILPLLEQTAEERAERLPTYDRSEGECERDEALIRRLQNGLPLSLADKRKARKLIKERRSA